MFNLFEILHQAQGGAAIRNMAQFYGLSPQQTEQAVAALLPAFTLGLQKNAVSNPSGFAQLFGQSASANVFDQPSWAFTPGAQEQGNAFVGQLFGSPNVAQAVVQQAAMISGVTAQVLSQMLPVIAGMIVTGVLQAAMKQPIPPPAPLANTPPGGMSWNDMVGAMFGQWPPKQPEAKTAPQLQNPFQAMMGHLLPAPGVPAPKPAQDAMANPFALFSQLFQTGLQVQEQHMKSLQGAFDSFWSTKPEQR